MYNLNKFTRIGVKSSKKKLIMNCTKRKIVLSGFRFNVHTLE